MTTRAINLPLRRILILIGIVTLVVVVGGTGCSYFTKSELEPVIIKVDSVTTVGTVSMTSALQLRFWGAVGPTSCYGYDRIAFTRTAGRIDVTVHGNRLTNASCATVVVPLPSSAMIEVAPPLQNPMTVQVRQPDGSSLTKTIAVP